MNKIMRVGTMDTGNGRQSSIYIKATVTDGKLSISGVIGPKGNGNATGGCGQIDMEFQHRNPQDNDKRYDNPTTPEAITFADGWDRDKWFDLLDIWGKWHLNDMQAGCKHQRDLGWGNNDLTVVTYRLGMEEYNSQKTIKEISQKRLMDGEAVKLTAEETNILALKWEIKGPESLKETPLISDYYTEKSRETKTDGWAYETEHPEGKLTKPCPVCGYKYGSAWLREDLPQEIIDKLEAMPDTDQRPAWI